MLFNSWSFLVFFPIVTTLYFVAPSGIRWLLLLVASCAFYMSFIPIYILVLAATIVVDYYAAIRIEEAPAGQRRLWLIGSIVVTCLILFFFKYYDFVAWNVTEASRLLHSNITMAALHLILPIGLSFHTFQSLSYVIEVYSGNQKAERHFGIYALYVMFYPQLVAGPIERPQNLLHQFRECHQFNYDRVVSGLQLMAWGLFKKAVIADRLAQFVSPVYGNPVQYDGGVLIVATLFFSFQVFCDFSGYTDMARGAARVMGFELMINFDRPYAATSVSDFWRRWHISLSTWLRDYIFEPVALGLRERGIVGIVVAFLLTFFISGLWHGANWTFVTWGMLHGFALSFEAVFAKQRRRLAKTIPASLFHVVTLTLTFSFVSFTYVFFRAQSMADAILILKSIFNWFLPLDRWLAVSLPQSVVNVQFGVVSQGQFWLSCELIGFLILVHLVQARWNVSTWFDRSAWWIRWPVYQAAVLTIAFMGEWLESKSFIYFQF
jgi:D-alanyl-lipoteichoic acid acyltransferase DltB (MBOAT superfamily)